MNNMNDANSERGIQPQVLSYLETASELLEWRWEGVLPKSGLVIIAGQSGVGKSSFAMDILARVTTGSNWLNEDANNDISQVNCLTYSQEETVALIMKHRARAAGADINKLFWISDFNFKSPDAMNVFVKVIKERNAKVVLIDPIVAIVKGNTNDLNDVRNSLEFINNFALENQVLIIGTTHVPKQIVNYGDELNQIIGSQAFGAVARVVIMIKKDKDDSRTMRVIKNNYYPECKSLVFKTEVAYLDDLAFADPVLTSKIYLIDSDTVDSDNESKLMLFEKRKSLVLNELEKGNGIRASTEMMKILKENGCSDYVIKCLKTALNINSKGKLTLNGKTVNIWKIGV